MWIKCKSNFRGRKSHNYVTITYALWPYTAPNILLPWGSLWHWPCEEAPGRQLWTICKGIRSDKSLPMLVNFFGLLINQCSNFCLAERFGGQELPHSISSCRELCLCNSSNIPILDTRISVHPSSSVILVPPPLEFERGWTGSHQMAKLRKKHFLYV